MNKWTLESTQSFPWPEFPSKPNEDKDTHYIGEMVRTSYNQLRNDVLKGSISLEEIITGEVYKKHEGSLLTSMDMLNRNVNSSLDGQVFTEWYPDTLPNMVQRISREMHTEFATRASVLELPACLKVKPHWYGNLFINGCHGLNVPSSLVDDIRSHIESDIKDLVENKREWPGIGYDNEFRYTRESHSHLYDALDKLFFDMEVIHAVETYMDNEMILDGVTLHVCKEDDKHWNMTMADKPPTPFENLHFDPKNGMMKCIFYLDDVKLDDGPFSYVLGSNSWAMEPFQNVVAKGVSVSNYMENGWNRAVFAELPKSMQYCANIGAFMTGDEDIYEQKYFYSRTHARTHSHSRINGSNLMIFDPGGLHRGGIVKNGGMRTNLQIMFRLGHRNQTLGFI